MAVNRNHEIVRLETRTLLLFVSQLAVGVVVVILAIFAMLPQPKYDDTSLREVDKHHNLSLDSIRTRLRDLESLTSKIDQNLENVVQDTELWKAQKKVNDASHSNLTHLNKSMTLVEQQVKALIEAQKDTFDSLSKLTQVQNRTNQILKGN